jgi:ribulose-phosphate 3-epimerase
VEILISPSVLNSHLSALADEVARIPSADFVHLDVMDNHFVPNLSFGLPVISDLRTKSDKPMDVHLMISDADRWAPAYAEAGCESVTFHIEASENPAKLIGQLHALGSRACFALKPATPIDPYEELLDAADMVLVMTVEPGFGGQSYMSDMEAKIARVRELAAARGTEIWVEVDGGISPKTIERAAGAGANVFVAGSAAYSAEDPDKVVEELRRLAAGVNRP